MYSLVSPSACAHRDASSKAHLAAYYPYVVVYDNITSQDPCTGPHKRSMRFGQTKGARSLLLSTLWPVTVCGVSPHALHHTAKILTCCVAMAPPKHLGQRGPKPSDIQTPPPFSELGQAESCTDEVEVVNVLHMEAIGSSAQSAQSACTSTGLRSPWCPFFPYMESSHTCV